MPPPAATMVDVELRAERTEARQVAVDRKSVLGCVRGRAKSKGSREPYLVRPTASGLYDWCSRPRKMACAAWRAEASAASLVYLARWRGRGAPGGDHAQQQHVDTDAVCVQWRDH
jgi:hypothetical protein